MRNTFRHSFLGVVLLLSICSVYTLSSCSDNKEKEEPTEKVQETKVQPTDSLKTIDSMPVNQHVDTDKTEQTPPPLRQVAQ